ncbi:myosin heavy chain, striated muscle-like [Montipora foliosa]|uniref:myosin heavy chain, striated muscle-like n=1 Tax=Montipora foliosa TaxID=591990 RepID=UPI0035F1A841
MLWYMSQHGGLDRCNQREARQNVRLHSRGLKQKQSCLEERNKELETSLEFAHSLITALNKKVDAQDKAIKQLQEGVKSLTKQIEEEKQRSVKLESHSRRNNLNFFDIPEEKDESFQTSENVLRRFMEVELKLSKRDSKEISFERVHRIGKSNSNNSKPRPLIAKFTIHKNGKELVLAQAKNLRGTNFAIARDFPKEIVEKRKLLVPILKDAKKSGHDAKLIHDKLYNNGQLHRS